MYIDYVIVFCTTVSDHFDHLRPFLTLLRNADLTLRLDKCFFLQTKVDYLGHVVRPVRLSVDDKTVVAVHGMAPSQTITELRSFIGLCKVYRRFVPDFALNGKLKKNDLPLTALTASEMEAFVLLKTNLQTTPVIDLPRAHSPLVLDTDACDVQVGAVLQQ